MITCLALSPSLDVTYLVPTVIPGRIHRPHTVLRLAGGKAINVARAASVLGGKSRVIGAVGGHSGAFIGELLRASGIPFDAIETGGETRSCLTIAADDSDGLTEFYEPPAPLGPDIVQAVASAIAHVPLEDRIVLAGSIPPLDLRTLGEALRGRRLVLDTHGEALATLVDIARPEIVKVNRSEASALLHHSDAVPLERLAIELRERVGGTVVITDGAAGSIGVDDDGVHPVGPDPLVGRYPVGSGDSFLAGLLVALDESSGLPDALRLAAAAGSANAQGVGAAVFTREQVSASLNRLVLAPR